MGPRWSRCRRGLLQHHYDDEVQFTVQATRELVEVVVPFMDAHLPESYKREQYLEWRGAAIRVLGASVPPAEAMHGRRLRSAGECVWALPSAPMADPAPVGRAVPTSSRRRRGCWPR